MERIQNFRKIFTGIVENAEDMIETLKDMNFFKAPASTKYHGAYTGDLFDHSLSVMNNLLSLTDKLGLNWELLRSPYIIGIFHDLCKCDSYRYDAEKNAFVWNSPILSGHGDKSVILTQQLFANTGNKALTDEEILCIRWHMGAFDDKENWNNYGEAIEAYPNVLFTHTADMMATRIDLI